MILKDWRKILKKIYRLEFYVPETHLEEVKNAIFKAGAGIMENYDCCSWETLGTGQFKPLEGSNPFIGTHSKLEQVKEYKVETICAESALKDVIAALKKSHPYELPAYQIIESFIM